MNIYQCIFLTLSLLLIQLSVQFIPNRPFTVIQSPIDIEISPNQYYTVVNNKTHAAIYNAQTGHLLQIIPSQYQYISIDYQKNSEYLAISNSNAQVQIYKSITFEQKQGVQMIEINKFMPLKQQILNVVDICFLKNGQFLVIAYDDGNLYAWDLVSETIFAYFNGIPSRIACSDINQNQFVVAGKSVTNQIIITTYIVNSQTSQITVKQNIDTANISLTLVNYITYNPIDNSIYVIGDKQFIYKFEQPTHALSILYTGKGKFYKVKILGNQDSFVVCNSTTITIGQTIKNDQAKNNLNQFIIISYDSYFRSFAITKQADRFMYVNELGIGRYLGACKQGQYLDAGTNTCVACKQSCSLCTSTSSTCFECATKHYLYQKTCYQCEQKCLQCSNGNSCTTCQQDFDNIDGKCVCKEQYQLIDNVCVSKGVKFWIIALIVGGSILVFAVLFVVVSIISSKRNAKKKDKLLKDNQEAQNPI